MTTFMFACPTFYRGTAVLLGVSLPQTVNYKNNEIIRGGMPRC